MKIDKIITEIKEQTGLEIINKSNQGIPLFEVSYSQPFQFNVTIDYNSIKGQSGFTMHLPLLYIKPQDINAFTQTILYITSIINRLNEAFKEDFNDKWAYNS